MSHRSSRRSFRQFLLLAFLPLLGILLFFTQTTPALAACPASFPVTVPAGDTARLIEVIGCANATAGNDVINLASASTYTLTAAHSGNNGLPAIVSAATAGTLTINGNGATVSRSSAGGTPEFRLLQVGVGANLTLNNVRLTNASIFGNGGAIYNTEGTLTLIGSTIDANNASRGGGIYSLGVSTTIVRESLISNNVANLVGGGIYNESGGLNLINSTVSGNTASGSGGGGIYTFGTVGIYNSTITNNTATLGSSSPSSGIWQNAGTLTIQNSIVAGNKGDNNCELFGVTLVDGGRNIDNGTNCGFGGNSLSNTNPNLSALGNNGGTTLTHGLLPSSPAINAGSNALAVDHTSAALATDQRGAGFQRIKGGTVDIGAYESVCPTFPATIAASDTAALIDAITCANGTTANDVINLASGSTYTLTTINADGTGLPPIVTTATAGTLTINGNGSTITRSSAGGTPEFRLITLNSGANLTLNQVRLTNGLISGGTGGAINNAGGMLRLTASTISGNRAIGGAGIHNNSGGTTVIRDSTLSGNTATSYAGGIANSSATLRVVNSTISGNSATGTNAGAGGGAINSYGTGSSMRFWNSTITNNTAVAPNVSKSGIWQEAGNSGYFNTIIANNNGANNCAFTGGTWTNNAYVIDSGTSCGFTTGSYNNTNPLLAPLANNGGFTQTHALLPGSPAINHGDNGYAVEEDDATPLTTDQRGVGFPRIVGGTVDIGAFETFCTGSPYTIGAADAVGLISAITCANSTPANDVINLASGSTYTLTTANADIAGVPAITAGSGTLTINGNGATITRSSAGGTPDFRIVVLSAGSNLTLNQVRLTNGRTSGSSGAIFNGGGTLNLISSTLDSNNANNGAGIFNGDGSTTTLRDSTLSNNMATGYGAAIANANATLNVINSTISGNSVTVSSAINGGGAIDAFGATSQVTIINSTIVNNTTVAPSVARSGIWWENGTLTIRNSIVANNNGTNNCERAGKTLTASSNNIDNGMSCGFGAGSFSNTNPLIGTLGNNGGMTFTHALLSGSPAFNAGSNALAVDQTSAALTTDQRGAGFPRIVGGTVDVGAFELQCPTFPATIAAGDTAALIFAINCANGTIANDVINLASASTYTLTSIYGSETGLPGISDVAAGGTLTINGNGAIIARSSAGGTPDFRLFLVNGGANLTLNRVTLTNGSVGANSGGAILNSGTLTVTSSTISGNSGTTGGGINTSGTLFILNSTISGNTATLSGGGIQNTGTTAVISNSTFSGNSSPNGGAINSDTSLTLINSTLSGNSSESGAGIRAYAGTYTLNNTIIANSTGVDCLRVASTVNARNSLIEDGLGCVNGTNTANLTGDPSLAPLGNNGGFTFTHALLPGSIAFNAGSNALAVDHTGAALTTDQRGAGFPRILGGTVDIGAYESFCTGSPYNIAASDVTGLITAITCANGTTANDVINLTNSTYTLTTVNAEITGLPPILSGSGTLTVNGSGATITRSAAGGTPNFRIFYVETGGNLTLNRVTLTNGSVGASDGGAIVNLGTLTVRDSTISGNSAVTSGGGGISHIGDSAVMTITGSTISGNAARNGGGLKGNSGTIRVINSTISGNQVVAGGEGGGAMIFYNNPTVQIINSTITNNTSPVPNANRSGIWLTFSDSGTVTIQNSIVAGNNGTNNCLNENGTIVNGGNNIDNGTTCGFASANGSQSNTNPLLGTLANNGGFTFTHVLLPSSPAFNAGSNALAVDHTGAALTTDQRGAGFPRRVGGTVDVGAYEAACPTSAYTIAAGDTAALIVAIHCANGTTANDVINLTAGSTYALTSVYGSETGLPPILNTATGGTLTINGNGATITRSSAGGTPEFRILYVNSGSNLTLNNVRLTNGLISGSGGAISNEGGTLTLIASTVDSNNAITGAGINTSNGGTTTLRDSTVSNNVATLWGGGITNARSTLYVINSTISGNRANGTSSIGGGGGIDSFGSVAPSVLIINSTITNNTAATSNTVRSGIWQETGTLTIRNSIVANNNGANNCAFTGGTRTDSGGNLDNGTSCGFTGAVGQNANANLAPLASNGGLTQTHALLPGSAAINNGINANATDQLGAALTTDQRGSGFPRINNTTVDIGAFESNISTLNVLLTLQGRPAATAHPSRVITVRATIMPSGGGTPYSIQTFVTTQTGSFVIPNLPVGTYSISFKGTHTLARRATITISAGANNYTTLALLEGDANDNNSVTLPDFSILATAFGKALGDAGYDARADFNGDNIVSINDFSLLASNFGTLGE